MKEKTFNPKDEELRWYFNFDAILKGIFELIKRIFGIEVRSGRTTIRYLLGNEKDCVVGEIDGCLLGAVVGCLLDHTRGCTLGEVVGCLLHPRLP